MENTSAFGRSWTRLGFEGGLAVLLLALACTRVGEDASLGAPPRAKGSVGLPVRWEKLDIALCVAEPAADLGLTPGELVDLVRDGVAVWGVERSLHVSFCGGVTAPSEDGRNVLAFESPGSAVRGHPYGRTHLYTRRSGTDDGSEEIVEADIQLGVNAVRATRDRGRAALESIVRHELGHFLGLAHACSGLKKRTSAGPPACADLESKAERLPLMHPSLLEQVGPLVRRPSDRERRAAVAAFEAVRSL